ncbi:MarR family transcriptional regulator [Plantibacter flavus]|uniref:MarR family winged helix-turn-helix transcriptional regulator n=1 Tax=Plantibacter flavus TaxID=150123 RepID=UPI003F1499F8
MSRGEEYIGFLIRRAQQAHVAAWQREVSTEITSVQFGVLDVVDTEPGVSQRELCDRLDLDRSTIADVVARLERRGLLARVRLPEDRRRNVLDTTEQGELELRALRPRVARMDAVLTAPLDDAERAALAATLTRLLDR